MNELVYLKLADYVWRPSSALSTLSTPPPPPPTELYAVRPSVDAFYAPLFMARLIQQHAGDFVVL